MEDLPDFMTDNNGKSNGRDTLGRFALGNPGRPPGAVNQARRAIKDFVNDQVRNLPEWFQSLDSHKERLDYLIRLMAYSVPRLQAVEFVADPENKGPRIDWAKLKPETIKEILNASE